MTIKIESYKDIPENYTGIVEHPDGTKEWYLNGWLHRVDGPAIEHPDGTKYWYLNGERHRTNGPAIKHPNGREYWYINDKRYTKEEHFQYVAEHYPESIRKLIWG